MNEKLFEELEKIKEEIRKLKQQGLETEQRVSALEALAFLKNIESVKETTRRNQ